MRPTDRTKCSYQPSRGQSSARIRQGTASNGSVNSSGWRGPAAAEARTPVSGGGGAGSFRLRRQPTGTMLAKNNWWPVGAENLWHQVIFVEDAASAVRSEERRVGKECR